MGKTLNLSSQLFCPHQAKIQVVPAQQRVHVDGQPALSAQDQMIIAGCPFAPGGAASPCVNIEWSGPNQRCEASGLALLSEDSVGLCLNAAGAPQGRVVVQRTQSKVTTE